MILLKDFVSALTVSQNIIVKDENSLEVLLNASTFEFLLSDSDPILNREITHISATDKNIILVLIK